jgi:hypothetical protein
MFADLFKNPAVRNAAVMLLTAVVTFFAARLGFPAPVITTTEITKPVEFRTVAGPVLTADDLADLEADRAGLEPVSVRAARPGPSVSADPAGWFTANEADIRRGLASRFVQRRFRDFPEVLAPFKDAETFAAAAKSGQVVQGMDPERLERVIVFIERTLPALKVAAMIYPPAAPVIVVLGVIVKRYRETHPVAWVSPAYYPTEACWPTLAA